MALSIYDIGIDATREATQADIDMLMAVSNAYGRLRAAVADTHAELVHTIAGLRSKGKIADLAALQIQTETNDAAPTEG